MAKKKVEAAPNAAYNIFDEFGESGNHLIRSASTGRELNVMPTGVLALDLATGMGGIRRGTIITITGPENVGKSTTAYRFIANAQMAGMKTLYFDTETRWSPDIAEANGVNLEEDLPENERSVGVIQWSPSDDPEVARGTLQNVQYAVRKFFTQDEQVRKHGGVLVIDSVNGIIAAQTEQGADGSDEDKGAGEGGGIALIPRMLSNWLRELTALIKHSGSYGIVTRQMRSQIGVMTRGDAISFSGGWALKHYASLDVLYKNIGKVQPTDAQKKDGWERMGNTIQITVRKNTAGTFGRQAQFNMSTENGPDDGESIIRYGIMFGIVKKSGAYYSVLLPNGEWSKNMYASDIIDWFWQDEEHLAMMYAVTESIRQASLKIPKQRIVGVNDANNTGEQ